MKLLLSASILAAFAIGCSKDDEPEPEPTSYDLASVSKGGIMYDKFWSQEAGFDQNNANIATFNAKPDFFRCKQCHAWDLLGTYGSYINRAPTANRPNIAAINLYDYIQTKTPQELFDGMKKTTNRRDISYDLSTYDPATNATIGDQMPNYTQYLTDAQIWDLVKFMKAGAFDVKQLYDATYTGVYPTGSASYSNVGKDGNAANGNTYYTANCVICHGADGTTIELEGKTLGNFLRSKPNEVQHKVKYGQLGSDPYMAGEYDITLTQMKDLYKACADVTAFPN